MPEPKLLDFTNSGRYKGGNILVFKQLTRLAYNFKKAGQAILALELFLKAIKILLKGEPAYQLDLIPRIYQLIDKYSLVT